jgi:2'-5' RNA ligase
VATLASDLAGRLPAARARTRGRHTLVVKRLGDGDHAQLSARARDALRGSPTVAARVAGVDLFERPASGPSPVVYLRVESPGLQQLHETLAAAFPPVAGIEGADYVPHVTVARGGNPDRARELVETEVDPIEWTVDELVFWDADREQPGSRLSLPA